MLTRQGAFRWAMVGAVAAVLLYVLGGRLPLADASTVCPAAPGSLATAVTYPLAFTASGTWAGSPANLTLTENGTSLDAAGQQTVTYALANANSQALALQVQEAGGTWDTIFQYSPVTGGPNPAGAIYSQVIEVPQGPLRGIVVGNGLYDLYMTAGHIDDKVVSADTYAAQACAQLDADAIELQQDTHGDLWAIVGAVVATFAMTQVLRKVMP